jgi:hypothetical protein
MIRKNRALQKTTTFCPDHILYVYLDCDWPPIGCKTILSYLANDVPAMIVNREKGSLLLAIKTVRIPLFNQLPAMIVGSVNGIAVCCMRERRPAIPIKTVRIFLFNQLPSIFVGWDRWLLRERRPAIGYQNSAYPSFNQMPAMIVGTANGIAVC